MYANIPLGVCVWFSTRDPHLIPTFQQGAFCKAEYLTQHPASREMSQIVLRRKIPPPPSALCWYCASVWLSIVLSLLCDLVESASARVSARVCWCLWTAWEKSTSLANHSRRAEIARARSRSHRVVSETLSASERSAAPPWRLRHSVLSKRTKHHLLERGFIWDVDRLWEARRSHKRVFCLKSVDQDSQRNGRIV